MTGNDLPDFSGKLVLFYTSDAPRGIQDGILMEYINFTNFGGRLFLTGRIPSVDENGMDWISDLHSGISWDSVIHYVVFKSREDYVSRTGNAKIPLLKRLLG